jgi:hypothetical protein
MLRDRINHGVRASAALALRHTPELRGRWRVASVVNKHFAPISQSFCTAWTRMRLGHDMLVDLRSDTEFHSYYLGDFDTQAIRCALRLLRPDSTVLDVGANIGFWSVPLAGHLKGQGCLHAFEPVSMNCRRLAENVRRNALEGTVHIHQSGLSDQNRSLRSVCEKILRMARKQGTPLSLLTRRTFNSIGRRYKSTDWMIFPTRLD